MKLLAYWQEDYPLECEAPARANLGLVWSCQLESADRRAHLSMTIFGSSGESLSRISISIVRVDPEDAATPKRWLSYAAGIPIAGTPLEQVRAWIDAGSDGTMSAGSVNYSLHVSGVSHMLDITR